MRLELERRILEIVRQRSKNGVIQSELWSILGIDNREGSRAVLSLMRKGLIRREQVIYKGRKTYVLKYTPEKLERVNLRINLNPVIKIPCFTCKELYKCGMGGFFNPFKCNLLTYFIVSSFES